MIKFSTLRTNFGLSGSVKFSQIISNVVDVPKKRRPKISQLNGRTKQNFTSGIIARYTTSGYDSVNKIWYDDWENNNTVETRGTPIVKTSSMGGVLTLAGTTSDGLRFPAGILPPTYTLVYVARYASRTNQGRILEGIESTSNDIFCFHDKTSGRSHRQNIGWITETSSKFSAFNHADCEWIIGIDTKYTARYNGNNVFQLSTATTGNTAPRLAINFGLYHATEASDWEIAEITVYNREITLAECKEIERFLGTKYNIPYFAASLNAIPAHTLPYLKSWWIDSSDNIQYIINTPTTVNGSTYAWYLENDVTSRPVAPTSAGTENQKMSYDGVTWEYRGGVWKIEAPIIGAFYHQGSNPSHTHANGFSHQWPWSLWYGTNNGAPWNRYYRVLFEINGKRGWEVVSSIMSFGNFGFPNVLACYNHPNFASTNSLANEVYWNKHLRTERSGASDPSFTSSTLERRNGLYMKANLYEKYNGWWVLGVA